MLGISGSLRRESYNTQLLRAAAQLLPSGAELVLLDPELLRAVPAYDDDVQASGEAPPSVARLREEIAQADGVLFATPEYNSSIPGFLKNALDWVSRPLASSPLKGKDVAVVGASTGMFGAVWAQAELRKVLAAIGARVVDRELPVMTAAEAFGDGDLLADREQHEQLAAHVEALVDAARITAGEQLQPAA
ncbi:MAG TPA: NAD(P)H-dependent oxidoreductase [Solirubrobacteraceae bacterium]|nr:NAD(P)H-dependent oxidoreductase [Solirubrobacteraceae bacterium]